MIVPSAKDNLALWFTRLQNLQSACPNQATQDLTLLAFANANIITELPTANEQGEFILAIQNSPGFDASSSDLTNFATFEALLDSLDWLPSRVGTYLQTLATGNFPGGSAADFLNALVSLAFPGGSKGAVWTKAVGLLASVIPSVCFSANLQAAVAKTIDDATKLVSDLVNQISQLG